MVSLNSQPACARQIGTPFYMSPAASSDGVPLEWIWVVPKIRVSFWYP